jgi:HK97 gp10 family phage protein
MSADVSQLRRLARDLRAAAGRSGRLAQQVVAKTAADIERDAKTAAPVDTGALRNSISHDLRDGGLTAEIGPTVHYAPFLEYGTSRMAPRPYLGPAAARHTPLFEKAIEALADKVL